MTEMNLTHLSATPPEGKPIYRYLTGVDDHAFCERVSAELEKGWILYGNPTLSFDGNRVICGQVIIWPEAFKHHVDDVHHRWSFGAK